MYYSNQPIHQFIRTRFEFRKSRAQKALMAGTADGRADFDGTVQVYIYVNEGCYGPYSTNIRTTRGAWENRSVSAIDDPTSLAAELIAYRNSLLGAGERLRMQGLPLTANMLMDHRIPKPERVPMSVFEAFEWYLSMKQLQVYRDKRRAAPDQISPQTFYRYGTRLTPFKDYLTQTGQSSLLLLQCDISFVRGWQRWAIKRGLQMAYRSKCLALLKSIIREAVLEKLIPCDTLSGLRLSHPVATPVVNLADEEIDRLAKMKLSERLTKVRDAFLVSLELCLHYADYYALRDHHFVKDESGAVWLEKPREKSPGGREVQHVPVSDRAQRIINCYGGVKRLPRKTLSAFNRDLKVIAQAAELKRDAKFINLTFSHARDAGIGRLVRTKKSELSICAIAGWTTTQYLRRYAVIDRSAI